MATSNDRTKPTFDPNSEQPPDGHPYAAIAARSGYELHSLARVFPAMQPDEYAGLKRSIDQDGQQRAIVMNGALVLDGVHRLAACLELELEPQFEEYEGSVQEMRAFVLAENLHRRHLSVAQRSLIASEMASGKHGGDRSQADSAPTQKEAAALMDVSPRSVRTARKVQAQADSGVVESMRAGSLSLNAAVKSIGKAAPEAAADKGRDKHIPGVTPLPPLDIANPPAGNCSECGKRTDGGLLDEGVCLDCRLEASRAAKAVEAAPEAAEEEPVRVEKEQAANLPLAQSESISELAESGASPFFAVVRGFVNRLAAAVVPACQRVSDALGAIPADQIDAVIESSAAEMNEDERAAWLELARHARNRQGQ